MAKPGKGLESAWIGMDLAFLNLDTGSAWKQNTTDPHSDQCESETIFTIITTDSVISFEIKELKSKTYQRYIIKQANTYLEV